jgi:hypothetical protein
MSISNSFSGEYAMLSLMNEEGLPKVTHDYVERNLGMTAFNRREAAAQEFLTEPLKYMEKSVDKRQRYMDRAVSFFKSMRLDFISMGFPEELARRYALGYAKQLLAMYLDVHAQLFPHNLNG